MSAWRHPKRREKRREEALKRQEARNKLTPNQQLDRLNTLGLVAKRERRKLEAAIEKAKNEAKNNLPKKRKKSLSNPEWDIMMKSVLENEDQWKFDNLEKAGLLLKEEKKFFDKDFVALIIVGLLLVAFLATWFKW